MCVPTEVSEQFFSSISDEYYDVYSDAFYDSGTPGALFGSKSNQCIAPIIVPRAMHWMKRHFTCFSAKSSLGLSPISGVLSR
jgi:hypothetical protein